MKAISILLLTILCGNLIAQGPPTKLVGPPRSRLYGPPAVQSTLLSPAYASIAAAADIQTVNYHLRREMRYLTLYNIPPEDRLELINVLNAAINGTSRSKDLAQVYIVPGTDNSVIRICMSDYRFYDSLKEKYVGWSRDTYEKLATDNFYFMSDVIKTTTRVTETLVPKQRYAWNGYNYFLESYNDKVQTIDTKDQREKTYGRWVDGNAIATLIVATQSKVPIYRADQFFTKIVLSPFYYELLGLGDSQDDFFDMAFLDQKLIDRAKLDIRGVVVKSGRGVSGVIPVARQNRVIIRFKTVYGYLWMTLDTKKSINDRDYMRVLANEDFDATELIMSGLNGLQFYFLAEGNASQNPKKRQDEAPIEIAVDNTNFDRRVRCSRSCVTCHTDGIRPFLAMPQEHAKHLIDVVSPDYKKAQYLKERYVNNLADFVAADQEAYAKAIKCVTTTLWCPDGFTPQQYSRSFLKFFNRYAETDIDLEIGSREVGVPVKDLIALLAGAKNDPHLHGLFTGSDALIVRRDHWEQSFQHVMNGITYLRK